ncbi:hypothetical protein FB559_8170 [Actinoallomurus bryophytorum]|uniref:Uncharacterized protein n=1 Tax=Actinoallomurus bryophytorum TaxID=1490222 RepID=A0A543C1E2_9ACTN|nr:hypothetical protein FB559_8170 [Actinoallomurus bryophytorum]
MTPAFATRRPGRPVTAPPARRGPDTRGGRPVSYPHRPPATAVAG